MRAIALVACVGLLAAPSRAQTPTALPPITLGELEQLALQNNPTTVAASAEVQAARGRTRQVGSWPNPVIGYWGEELKRGDVDRRGEHGFFVEQTIPLGGKLQLSRNVFQKIVDRAEAIQEQQRFRILSSVRQTFYSILLMQRRIEVRERLAALASEAVSVTAQLFNVGAADRPDYLEIEIEARRVQLQLDRSKNELMAARSQLAALTGVRDVGLRPMSGNIEDAIPKFEQEEVVRRVLDQSPELRAARVELERTRAVTARVRRETYPDLFLRVGGAYNRERGEEMGRPVGWEGAVEAGVSVPLFNRHVGAVTAARADETRAQSEIARLELSLQSRAETEFAHYLSAVRAADMYRSEILPRAEEAYRLYLTRYREMAAAYPQVLVAQRTFFEMSSEYFDSLSEAWRSAVRLQGLLTGEGLEPPARLAGPND